MTAIPTLETERLKLRPIQPKDFEAYASFYQTDRSHMRGGPLSRNETWMSLRLKLGTGPYAATAHGQSMRRRPAPIAAWLAFGIQRVSDVSTYGTY